MKLSKSQLKQIIKEELEGTTGQQIYIVAEPSTTYEGEYTEIKLLGVFLDEQSAQDALESLAKLWGHSPELFAVPIGKIDRSGYTI